MFYKERERRIHIVMVGIGVVFIAISGKLFYEQVIHHESILKKAQNLWERDFHISGIRGSILDRNGYVLAQDIPSTSLVVVPAQIKDPTTTAKVLSEILEMDSDVLYERITKKDSTQKIQPEGR